MTGRPHPRHGLDELLLTPLRYSLLAAVGTDTEVDFGTLKALLETQDSPLSKAIATLGRAGYLEIRKGYADNRPRTWVKATKKGKRAFSSHTTALRAIADEATD